MCGGVQFGQPIGQARKNKMNSPKQVRHTPPFSFSSSSFSLWLVVFFFFFPSEKKKNKNVLTLKVHFGAVMCAHSTEHGRAQQSANLGKERDRERGRGPRGELSDKPNGGRGSNHNSFKGINKRQKAKEKKEKKNYRKFSFFFLLVLLLKLTAVFAPFIMVI